MTRKGIAAAVVAASALAGTVWAAAQTTPKRGTVFAWRSSGLPALLAEPDPKARPVASVANGVRIHYFEVVGPDASPEWFHIDQIGLKPGWLSAADAKTAPPSSGPKTAVDHVEIGPVGAKMETVLTSAARGWDHRVLEWGPEVGPEDALRQLADLRSAVDHQMSDVPYVDDGKHVPGHRFDHTAEKRLADAKEWRDQLETEGEAR